MSVATARTRRTAPSATFSGTSMVNVLLALPTGGATALDMPNVIAPLPARSTRDTPLSSSASAITVAARPGTIVSAPDGVRSLTVGPLVSATGRITQAADVVLPATSVAVASRFTTSPGRAVLATAN